MQKWLATLIVVIFSVAACESQKEWQWSDPTQVEEGNLGVSRAGWRVLSIEKKNNGADRAEWAWKLSVRNRTDSIPINGGNILVSLKDSEGVTLGQSDLRSFTRIPPGESRSLTAIESMPLRYLSEVSTATFVVDIANTPEDSDLRVSWGGS